MQMKTKSIDLLCYLRLNPWRSDLENPLSLHIIRITECVSKFNIVIQHGIQSSSQRNIVNQDMNEKYTKTVSCQSESNEHR